jgi:hypothetical protein
LPNLICYLLTWIGKVENFNAIVTLQQLRYVTFVYKLKNIATMTTSTRTKHIDELHFEHQLWLNELKFYNDELKIYQNRLEEVALKNNAPEVNKQVGHFQNQFIIQKEQLDILHHLIKEHEQWLTKYAKENPIAIDKKLFANHIDMSDKAEMFKKIYTELKKEFNRFVAAYL